MLWSQRIYYPFLSIILVCASNFDLKELRPTCTKWKSAVGASVSYKLQIQWEILKLHLRVPLYLPTDQECLIWNSLTKNKNLIFRWHLVSLRVLLFRIKLVWISEKNRHLFKTTMHRELIWWRWQNKTIIYIAIQTC